MVTIVVPPMLPCLSLAAEFVAQVRLKFAKIYCLNPRNTLVCGALDCACFDKVPLSHAPPTNGFPAPLSHCATPPARTDRDAHRVGPRRLRAAPSPQRPRTPRPSVCRFARTYEYAISLESTHARSLLANTSLRFGEAVKSVREELPDGALLDALASCHTLLRLEGELVGDPADVKMFEATCWVRRGVQHSEQTSPHRIRSWCSRLKSKYPYQMHVRRNSRTTRLLRSTE